MLGVDTTNSFAYTRNNTSATYGLQFQNYAGTPWMTIASGGNVGIGTTSPGGRLAVSDGTSANTLTFIPGVIYNGSGTVTQSGSMWLDLPGTGTLSLSDNVIVNGGNVGIGTTAPASPLHVAAASAQSIFESTTAGNGAGLLFKAYDSDSTGSIGKYLTT
jgi:hypothetical protein